MRAPTLRVTRASRSLQVNAHRRDESEHSCRMSYAWLGEEAAGGRRRQGGGGSKGEEAVPGRGERVEQAVWMTIWREKAGQE